MTIDWTKFDKAIAEMKASVEKSTEPEIKIVDPYRLVGFTDLAKDFPRDDLAIALLAAFNNVRPYQLTEGMKCFPNASTAEAWKRVAQVAEAWVLLKEQDLKNQINDLIESYKTTTEEKRIALVDDYHKLMVTLIKEDK